MHANELLTVGLPDHLLEGLGYTLTHFLILSRWYRGIVCFAYMSPLVLVVSYAVVARDAAGEGMNGE